MLRFLLTALCAWAALQGFAQTLPQQLKHLYAPLNKSGLSTGYFFNQAVPWSEPAAYHGTLNDSNFVDMDIFGALYKTANNHVFSGNYNRLYRKSNQNYRVFRAAHLALRFPA
jgi:hypothetical protein